jgi:hypothetical protein
MESDPLKSFGVGTTTNNSNNNAASFVQGGGHSSLSAAEPLTFGSDPLTYQSLNTSPSSPRKRVIFMLIKNTCCHLYKTSARQMCIIPS